MIQETHLKRLTSDDVRNFFRNIDDHTLIEILALEPTYAQLEEAVAKAAMGAEEIFADRGSEGAVVAKIVELVGTDMEDFGE